MSDNVVDIRPFPTLRDTVLRHQWPKARDIPTQFERACRAAQSAAKLQNDLKLLNEFATDPQCKELIYSAINAVADAQIFISQVRAKS